MIFLFIAQLLDVFVFLKYKWSLDDGAILLFIPLLERGSTMVNDTFPSSDLEYKDCSFHSVPHQSSTRSDHSDTMKSVIVSETINHC